MRTVEKLSHSTCNAVDAADHEDFHTRRRKVFHRVFVELARVFERPTAIETDIVPQIVNEVIGAGFDRRSHPTGRLSLPLRPPILVPLRP